MQTDTVNPPALNRKPPSVKLQRFFGAFGKHALVWLVGTFFFVPFLWMVSTSLKTNTDIGRIPPRFIPMDNKTVTVDGETYPVYRLSDESGTREVAVKAFEEANAVVFYPDQPDQVEVVPKSSLEEVLVVSFRWKNYPDAMQRAERPGLDVNYTTYLKNSTVIAVLSVIGTLLSSTPVAYAFARIKFPGRNALFIFVLATMMLPFQVMMIPLFRLFNEVLHWGDTFLPLVVPTFFANAYDVFLLRQFFRTIPQEMSDAARVDGASEWQIFTRIVLPLSIPILSTISVFTFLWAWNDFTGPLIFLQSHKNYTMALGLQDFQGQRQVLWNQLMAASVIFTIPIITAFFFLQKQFIQGIKLTGLKE